MFDRYSFCVFFIRLLNVFFIFLFLICVLLVGLPQLLPVLLFLYDWHLLHVKLRTKVTPYTHDTLTLTQNTKSIRALSFHSCKTSKKEKKNIAASFFFTNMWDSNYELNAYEFTNECFVDVGLVETTECFRYVFVFISPNEHAQSLQWCKPCWTTD